MRILQVHNLYQQPGGEDQFSLAECELLTRYGHLVDRFTVHNDAVKQMSKIDVALGTIWNPRSYRAIRNRIQEARPDIIHAHNTFPLISPALYYAAEHERVPVVQTLHNYRLICPAATMSREGRICEDCLHTVVPYSGVVHACYRGSRLASATVAAMLTAHRLAGTWKHKIHTYIALTEFAKSKFVEGGLPEDKIVTKPIFVLDDPGLGSGSGGYVLFAGRLSEEKGLRTLLRSWEMVGDVPLKIVGDGPLRSLAADRARTSRNLDWLGFVERSYFWELMKNASVLVLPSEWYEGLPATAVEAMACGTPVLASDIGGLREVIVDGENGLPFRMGDAAHLAEQVTNLCSKPETLRNLRKRARAHYEANYTAERNYRLLREIYHRVQSEI